MLTNFYVVENIIWPEKHRKNTLLFCLKMANKYPASRSVMPDWAIRRPIGRFLDLLGAQKLHWEPGRQNSILGDIWIGPIFSPKLGDLGAIFGRYLSCLGRQKLQIWIGRSIWGQIAQLGASKKFLSGITVIKFHCSKRPYEDLSLEDYFYRGLKMINFGEFQSICLNHNTI